jgi:hypothetical protein
MITDLARSGEEDTRRAVNDERVGIGGDEVTNGGHTEHNLLAVARVPLVLAACRRPRGIRARERRPSIPFVEPSSNGHASGLLTLGYRAQRANQQVEIVAKKTQSEACRRGRAQAQVVVAEQDVAAQALRALSSEISGAAWIRVRLTLAFTLLSTYWSFPPPYSDTSNRLLKRSAQNYSPPKSTWSRLHALRVSASSRPASGSSVCLLKFLKPRDRSP